MKQISKFPIVILVITLLSLITSQLSAAVSINITKSDVTCGANGSITAEVTGATGPVTYAIKKQAEPLFGPQQAENYFYNLIPGTYVVAVYEGIGVTESSPVTLNNMPYTAMVVSGTPISGNSVVTGCDPDGSITITMVQGKGSPPFRYHLKGGPTSKPDIIGKGTTAYTASFTQLETGTYSIDITDACGNTTVASTIPIQVTSKYNFSNVTFGSLDGMGGIGLKGNGCNMSMSFSTDNIILKDNNGIVIFQRNINHAPKALPLEARVEYPAGSGIYTNWQSAFGEFVLPNYSPEKNTYKVEMRNPCNSSNVVVSPEYTMAYPYVSRAGYCTPAITHPVIGYNCGNVSILLTKITGTGVSSKSYTWDGVDASYTLDIAGLSGTYTVDITINGHTYRTTSINTASASSVSVALGSYNYICTNGCDFTTGTIRSYGQPLDNTVPITYTLLSGPVSRDPVTSTVALSPIWDNLPKGTYSISVDYGGCKTETVSRTVNPPFGGFKADQLSYIQGSTCGKYKITGKGWYLAPDSTISPTSDTYYAALVDASGKIVNGATTTAPSNTPFTIAYEVSPGTYTVKLVNAGNSQLVCWYQERTITIPPYSPLSIDVPNSGGLVCSGGNIGDLHIATKGGSGQIITFRVKPKDTPDTNYTPGQSSPDFTGLTAGEYTVEAKDACGFATTQNLTLGAVASASYFNVSGKSFASGQIAPRCEGAEATLALVVTGVAADVLWQLPDGTTSDSRILNFSNFSSANTGLYTVSYTSSGCTWNNSITLSLETDIPTFEFVSDTTACTSIDLTNLRLVSGNINNLTFTYWNNDYTQNVTLSAKNITKSGVYHIVGENLGGCSHTSTVNVIVRRLNDDAVADVLFVKQYPTGDGTGKNWDNALDGDFLAQYLRSSKPVNGTKIYVAAGTYYPVVSGCEDPTNRGFAFELAKNIRMRGGFNPAATGTDTISTWNFQTYVTRLSGDIGTIGTTTDNSYNVVRITSAGAMLDGFYVSDGNANGAASPNNIGAGIYVSKAIQLANLVVENNNSNITGGGIYAAAALALNNSTVSNNTAKTLGGGIYAVAALTLDNSTINNNTANTNGGGVYLVIASNLTNSTFYGNKSTTNGGAVYSLKTGSTVNFCTFYGNTAGTGYFSIYSLATSTFNNNIVQDNIGKSAMSGLKGSYNIVGFTTDATTLGGTTNKINTDITQLFDNIAAGQAILGNNGGVTKTLMLKYGGPAHNFIPTTVDVVITRDQRNFARPVGCGYEAGSVEIAEENKPDIKFIIPSVCYGTDIVLKDLITSATNVRDTLFFSDNLYSKPILLSTIKAEQSPIYVRFNTTANCVKDTTMALTINPPTATPIITNPAFCESGTIADLITRVTNLVLNGTVNCYVSEDDNTPLDPVSPLTDGMTYYVSQTSDKGCASPRAAIKVTIQQTPVVILTADDYFLCTSNNFTLHASITNVPSIPWYQWQVTDPITGLYVAGNTSDFYPGVTVEGANEIEDAIFTPSASSYDSEGRINLRIRVNTGACGYKMSEIVLHKNASDPAALIAIEEQPITLQTVCQDTAYVVKITDVGQGGLSDIKVTLYDWKSTDLTVTGAEYQYPIGSSWNALTIDNSKDSYKYECQIPSEVKLNEDAMLVRFKVKPECGFYAGSDVQFIANGYDNCHKNEIVPATVESDKFMLDFGVGANTEYALQSHLSTPVITNATSDPKKVTWTVDYYELVSGIPNFTTDSIYFSIPAGMNLDVNSFNSPNYAQGVVPEVRTVFPDGGIEYAVPLSVDVNSGRVSFSVDFTVTTAARCGVEQLYMEIIRQGELACGTNPEPCTFFMTLAQSYPELSVEWYQLQMSNSPTSTGRMQNGSWTGTLDIHAGTDIPAGAKIPFDFYVDNNGDANKDNADIKEGNTFEYEVVNAVPAGNTFSATITTPVPVTIDNNSRPLELLAYIPKEALVCESLTIPIVPLIGEQTVCEGDTLIYKTTPGMNLTTFNVANVDAISGATPKRISAEGNGDDWTKDTNKSQVRVVIQSRRGFDIKTQYRVGSENRLLNSTFMKITAIAKPVLALKNGASTAICKGGSGVDLSQSVLDTNNANPDTWYYYEKQSDGSYILLTTLPSGTPFVVSPLVNTVYGISSSAGVRGCESNQIDFGVTVKELPAGDISGDNSLCRGSAGIYFIDNTGNTAGWTYNWSVTGTTNSVSGNNTASSVNVNWKETGKLTAVFTDANGCSSTSTLSVGVLPLPVISNLVVSGEPCDPSREATMTFTVPGVDLDWQYDMDGDGFTDLPAGAIVQPDRVSLSLAEPETGRHIHLISIKDNNGCASDNVNFTTVFYPERSIWTANGIQSNWDDAANWDNGVPGPCTYVVISDDKSSYPWLTSEMNAVCDTIEFELGGEVARTDLLNYNAAKVHLGVNTMQWYSLSAPLRDMYSGDYMFKQANPITEMRLYNTTSPQTGAVYSDWTQAFNNTNIRLNTGIGYSTRVGKIYYGTVNDDGAVTNTKTTITNGSWVFPRTKMLFNFYDDITKKLLSKTEQIPAGGRDNGSRFAYEETMDGDVFVEIPTNRTSGGQNVVVGNPLMSHIDFEKFYYENEDIIAPTFKLLSNGTDFPTYSGELNGEGQIIGYISTGFPPLEANSIAPMQAFIVTTKDDYTGSPAKLKITKNMSVTAPGYDLRSEENNSNVLRITASNDTYASQAAVVLSENAKNGFDLAEDSRKMLIQGVTSAPCVFTITDGIYLDINRMNEFPISLPIGISTTTKGATRIHIEGFEQFVSVGKFSFMDTKTGTIPIQDDEFEYSFDNKEGSQIGRFYLLFSPRISTSIEKNSSKSMQIFTQDNDIHVISTVGNDIENVVIYNLVGQIIFQQHYTGKSHVVIPAAGLSSVVIVKANTSKTLKTSKLNIW